MPSKSTTSAASSSDDGSSDETSSDDSSSSNGEDGEDGEDEDVDIDKSRKKSDDVGWEKKISHHNALNTDGDEVDNLLRSINMLEEPLKNALSLVKTIKRENVHHTNIRSARKLGMYARSFYIIYLPEIYLYLNNFTQL